MCTSLPRDLVSFANGFGVDIWHIITVHSVTEQIATCHFYVELNAPESSSVINDFIHRSLSASAAQSYSFYTDIFNLVTSLLD